LSNDRWGKVRGYADLIRCGIPFCDVFTAASLGSDMLTAPSPNGVTVRCRSYHLSLQIGCGSIYGSEAVGCQSIDGFTEHSGNGKWIFK